MQTLLITTSPETNSNALLLDKSKFLDKHDQDKLEIAFYDDFAILMNSDGAQVLHPKLLLDDFKRVIFRNSINNWIMGYGIGYMAKKLGLSLSSDRMSVLDPIENKLAQTLLFNELVTNIRLPKTMYLQSWNDFGTKCVHENFKFPFVVKADTGMKGNDNFLVENEADFSTVREKLTREIIIQEYIENVGDYRVLYVGLGSPPLIFHRSSDRDTYLNNTSQGATATVTEDLPNWLIDDSKSIAQHMGFDIVGLDLMESSVSGEWYFIEANATPALLSGEFTTQKAAMLTRYINENNNSDE